MNWAEGLSGNTNLHICSFLKKFMRIPLRGTENLLKVELVGTSGPVQVQGGAAWWWWTVPSSLVMS